MGRAALFGWLPLIAINAFFAHRVPTRLEPAQSLLHHLYDAGQVLGLGAASLVLAMASMRLRLAWRAVAAYALGVGACYGLLAGDLESFLERHAGSAVPWHLLFALIGAFGIGSSIVLGVWIGRTRFWLLGLASGLVIGVGNHLVLKLDYPGTHFILAAIAASLMGASALGAIAALRLPRGSRGVLAVASGLSLLTYVVVPGPVVRSALLGSSGAVAAPFVAQAWAAARRSTVVSVSSLRESPWFAPRWDLPPIPPERMTGAPPAPIVILVTIDALRADLLERPGADAKATANLRAMAKRSLSFERAWSPTAYTMGSLRSLFLGTHYQQHGHGYPGAPPPKRGRKVRMGPYLAELLGKAGVRTVCLRSINALAGRRSVARGFEEEIPGPKRTTAGKVIRALLKGLGKRPQGPLFFYTHILDPHDPYSAGPEDAPPRQRYLAEVHNVDVAIGQLRRALRKRRLHRNTYLIVSADHGEAFGEHGHDFHATTVYEEMIRIPLLIEGPGVVARRVAEPASLIDVGPTVLSLFGAPTPGHFMGESLVPLMRGEDRRLMRPLAVDGGRAIRAVLFEQRWKAIVDAKRGTEEVYDLRQDPGEHRNLAETAEARPYLDALYAFFDTMRPKPKKR